MARKNDTTQLYLGKYFLALYDANDEWCVGVFDNCRELALHLSRSVNGTMCQVGRIFKGKFKKIDCKCLHFIEVNEEETYGINSR